MAFDQAPAAALLLDLGGRVARANAAARERLTASGSGDIVGEHIWDIVANDGAVWWRQAVLSARDGNTQTSEIGGAAVDAVTQWTVRALRDSTGTVVGLFAVGRDLTEQRQAEHEAQLLSRLALAIGRTDSLELAIVAALRTVCEASGWAMGEAWLPEISGEDTRLVRGAVWTTRDPKVDAFAAQGTGFGFARGEGLPGSAWARGEPVWERRLSTAQTFTRSPLAGSAGLKAAVAIPVLAGDEVVAVLSFYMSDARTDDTRFVRMTTAVATQLGPLIVQKRAEETHRVAEARLGGIVSISLDAIISIDEERRITLFNWGAEQIFGYAAEEVIGQSLDVLLPPDVRQRHAGHIAHFATSSQTARRMGERSRIAGLRKSGESFPAEASISRFRAGGHWTFTVTLRDITARQRTEEGLRFLSEAGALLSDLIRDSAALDRVAQRAVPTLGDACVIELIDDTDITTVAVAAVDPMLRDAIRTAIERDPPHGDSSDPALDTLRDGVTRLLPEHTDTRLGLGSLLIVPLIAQKKVIGAMRFAMARSGRQHDASYQALAEELAVRVALAVDGSALYQRARQAIGARDEVLAVVSHDLRNQLSAIKMCVGALREDPSLDIDTSQELLGTVNESASLMTRIIQDLLDVASIDGGRLSIDRRPQALAPVVTRATAMFESIAADQDISLTMDDGPTPFDVNIDGDRIVQVLANLLHNACKFTPAGGTIRVASVPLPGMVQVSVSDTGCGIAPDALPRVFDRFWHDGRSSKIRSTGLGLAIARGIIEAHGGRIWVESTPGYGSTFAFTLPLSAPAR
jgi:PAS domain S-box-containing protein